MSQGTIAGWGEYPPPLRQLQIEVATGGALKAEPDCDKYRVGAVRPARRTKAVA